jgi:hypothetical protein
MGLRTKTVPRIDPATPLSDLVVCHTAVIRSEWGPCWAGKMLRKDDPLVVAVPQAFQPLMDRIHAQGLA